MGATINLRGKGLELPGWLTGQNRLMRRINHLSRYCR